MKNVKRMKVREFIELPIDIDVYDNVCEELGIAYCGAYKLTDVGEAKFGEVMDLDIEVNEQFDYAVVDVDDKEGLWQHKLHIAKEFFESIAGYCTYTDFDKWFIEL